MCEQVSLAELYGVAVRLAAQTTEQRRVVAGWVTVENGMGVLPQPAGLEEGKVCTAELGKLGMPA